MTTFVDFASHCALGICAVIRFSGIHGLHCSCLNISLRLFYRNEIHDIRSRRRSEASTKRSCDPHSGIPFVRRAKLSGARCCNRRRLLFARWFGGAPWNLNDRMLTTGGPISGLLIDNILRRTRWANSGRLLRSFHLTIYCQLIW